jgi:hypothetical protein
MLTHFRIARRTALVAALAALCLPLSASAQDLSGDTQSEFGKTYTVTEPRAGDTPAEFGKTYSVPEPKAGDTPADYPGASRSPEAQPPVEIVRPERTIVRDSDPTLPVILAAAALLLALVGGIRVLSQRRAMQARVH